MKIVKDLKASRETWSETGDHMWKLHKSSINPLTGEKIFVRPDKTTWESIYLVSPNYTFVLCSHPDAIPQEKRKPELFYIDNLSYVSNVMIHSPNTLGANTTHFGNGTFSDFTLANVTMETIKESTTKEVKEDKIGNVRQIFVNNKIVAVFVGFSRGGFVNERSTIVFKYDKNLYESILPNPSNAVCTAPINIMSGLEDEDPNFNRENFVNLLQSKLEEKCFPPFVDGVSDKLFADWMGDDPFYFEKKSQINSITKMFNDFTKDLNDKIDKYNNYKKLGLSQEITETDYYDMIVKFEDIRDYKNKLVDDIKKATTLEDIKKITFEMK